jgi:hypothetical protein
MFDVQGGNVVVIHQRDREFRARARELSKQADCTGAKQARIDPA